MQGLKVKSCEHRNDYHTKQQAQPGGAGVLVKWSCREREDKHNCCADAVS